MNIKSTLFKKEWEQLDKYYKKKHTHEEANFYYSKLKDLSDEAFLKTLDNVYNNCKYFPNIAEIREQVLTGEALMELKMEQWENLKREPMTKEEQDELDEILKKYK